MFYFEACGSIQKKMVPNVVKRTNAMCKHVVVA